MLVEMMLQLWNNFIVNHSKVLFTIQIAFIKARSYEATISKESYPQGEFLPADVNIKVELSNYPTCHLSPKPTIVGSYGAAFFLYSCLVTFFEIVDFAGAGRPGNLCPNLTATSCKLPVLIHSVTRKTRCSVVSCIPCLSILKIWLKDCCSLNQEHVVPNKTWYKDKMCIIHNTLPNFLSRSVPYQDTLVYWNSYTVFQLSQPCQRIEGANLGFLFSQTHCRL